jgi:hypothetical protein
MTSLIALAVETAAFMGHEEGLVTLQGAALPVSIVEVGPESLLGSKRSAAIKGERLGAR